MGDGGREKKHIATGKRKNKSKKNAKNKKGHSCALLKPCLFVLLVCGQCSFDISGTADKVTKHMCLSEERREEKGTKEKEQRKQRKWEKRKEGEKENDGRKERI